MNCDELQQQIIQVLRTIYDPEIPVNIYDLGLIYDLKVDEAGAVSVRMTLTAPGCPVAGSLPPTVGSKIRSVPGVTEVNLDLVFDPPWSRSRMSESAKLALGVEDIISVKGT
ncbi:MAG: SUF system Fe-S cluster assembly protein [Bryobacteraceae bacterium]